MHSARAEPHRHVNLNKPNTEDDAALPSFSCDDLKHTQLAFSQTKGARMMAAKSNCPDLTPLRNEKWVVIRYQSFSDNGTSLPRIPL